MTIICPAVVLTLLLAAAPALAGESEIVGVKVRAQGADTYVFDVTLRHADEGWEHYADRWDVLSPDGDVLGTRVLYHPHVDEQPFTRALSGVSIPATITTVTIRAHDTVHGWAHKTVQVPLPK